MSNLQTSVRSSNFEALRIVCMLFIIAGHLIMWHNFKSEYVERIVNSGIRPLFMVAVNCFVLISGWFSIKFKFKKILSLNSTLTFWTFVLCAVALFLGIHTINPRNDVLMLVPLLTKRYWFITVYVALCFLSPYLNIFVQALTKGDFKKLLITSICIFVILPTFGAIFNFGTLTDDSGYGIVNFILLYLLGRYMRLYETPLRPAWQYFIAYVLLMCACGIFQVSYSHILGFEFTTLISYDTFFVFFGAVMLFCAFSRLEFKNKYINALASTCFACYIIHIHPWIGSWTFEDWLGLKNIEDKWFLLCLVIIPVLTYLGCFLLEQIRLKAYKLTPPPINSH